MPRSSNDSTPSLIEAQTLMAELRVHLASMTFHERKAQELQARLALILPPDVPLFDWSGARQ
jgi:hypothetical protein